MQQASYDLSDQGGFLCNYVRISQITNSLDSAISQEPKSTRLLHFHYLNQKWNYVP